MADAITSLLALTLALASLAAGVANFRRALLPMQRQLIATQHQLISTEHTLRAGPMSAGQRAGSDRRLQELQQGLRKLARDERVIRWLALDPLIPTRGATSEQR